MTVEATGSIVGRGRDLAEFVEAGFGKRILASTDRMTTVLAGFRPGQEILAHAPQIDLVVSILDGDGTIRVGDDIHHVRAGDVAVIPAGEVRAIKAGEAGMVALHVVSPPPTESDHQPWQPELAWPELSEEGARVAEKVADEHSGLRPTIDGLASLAEIVATLPADERQRRIENVAGFLRGDLLSHAGAEEGSIYPAAERVLRARGGAVGTMTLGHEAIAALVAELESAAGDDGVDRLVRVLHSIRAIALLHLDEEEKVYLPALSGLSHEETAELMERLGLNGHGGKGRDHV